MVEGSYVYHNLSQKVALESFMAVIDTVTQSYFFLFFLSWYIPKSFNVHFLSALSP